MVINDGCSVACETVENELCTNKKNYSTHFLNLTHTHTDIYITYLTLLQVYVILISSQTVILQKMFNKIHHCRKLFVCKHHYWTKSSYCSTVIIWFAWVHCLHHQMIVPAPTQYPALNFVISDLTSTTSPKTSCLLTGEKEGGERRRRRRKISLNEYNMSICLLFITIKYYHINSWFTTTSKPGKWN